MCQCLREYLHSSLGMMCHVEDWSNALQLLTLAEVISSVMYRVNRNLSGLKLRLKLSIP